MDKPVGNVTIKLDAMRFRAPHSDVSVDGVHVRGVTKIEITHGVNDVCHAVIHLIPEVIEISSMDSKYCEFVRGVAQVVSSVAITDETPALIESEQSDRHIKTEAEHREDGEDNVAKIG